MLIRQPASASTLTEAGATPLAVPRRHHNSSSVVCHEMRTENQLLVTWGPFVRFSNGRKPLLLFDVQGQPQRRPMAS